MSTLLLGLDPAIALVLLLHEKQVALDDADLVAALGGVVIYCTSYGHEAHIERGEDQAQVVLIECQMGGVARRARRSAR